MEDLIRVTLGDPRASKADLFVVGVFEGEEPPEGLVAEGLRPVAQRLTARSGWKGRDGQRVEGEGRSGEGTRLALRGLGKRQQLHVRKLHKWLLEAVEDARGSGSRTLAIALPEHSLTTGAPATGHLARQLALAGYRFERFRERDEEHQELDGIELLLAGGGDQGAAGRELATAQVVARAIVTARNLGNTPPNVATPEWMAEQARELATEGGLEAEVLVTEDLERLGMGGLLAVGSGSQNPPRLVRLTWKGAESPRVALVGKGITFDSGGISIKPAKDLDEMKYDKCGACTVIALMQAVAQLGIAAHVTAYVPLAENMLDGRAYRPGDIIRCHNGKSVEVLNTDAEGRLILADALSWAATQSPDHLVELSTLTGSCVVALGSTGAGLFTPNDALARDLLEVADESGERLWRLPLWPEFKEPLQGLHGDLKNIGGRWGGASIAAAFLSSFVGEVESWAHLDIAGPAYVGSDGEGPRGATGYGVALLARWLGGRAA